MVKGAIPRTNYSSRLAKHFAPGVSTDEMTVTWNVTIARADSAGIMTGGEAESLVQATTDAGGRHGQARGGELSWRRLRERPPATEGPGAGGR